MRHLRSASAIVATALASGAAHDVRADPAATLDRAQPAPAPVLELDPSLALDSASRTALEGIGAERVDVDHAQYALGPRTSAETQTALWSNDRDVRAQGWTLDARVARDLGWNTSLVLEASLARAVGGLDRSDATYASVGLSLVHLFHLAHQRTAWISLGVAWTSWFDGGAAPQLPGGIVAGVRAGISF